MMKEKDDYDYNKYIAAIQRHSSIAAAGSAVHNMIAEDFRGDSYCTKVLLSAAIGLCHVLIGSVIMTNIFFSMQTDDEHSITFALAVSRTFYFLTITASSVY